MVKQQVFTIMLLELIKSYICTVKNTVCVCTCFINYNSNILKKINNGGTMINTGPGHLIREPMCGAEFYFIPIISVFY